MANFSRLWNNHTMKITLSVTGSISAYKSYDLARELVKSGHRVRVLVSQGALKFIRKETFSYLGCEKVYSPQDDFEVITQEDSELEGSVLHVALAKWADKGVIAPLSANTLATLCQGAAPDLISSLFLAWRREKPLIVFPAMNSEMLSHPFVKDNFQKLSTLSHVFVGPTQSGLLACGDKGAGKLASIEEMKALIETYGLSHNDKSVLITTGATVAPLDSVRYLTNASSGKTAIPFIEECLAKGMTVKVLAGVFATKELEKFSHHPSFQLLRFKSTSDLFELVKSNFPQCDLYISCAAIGDFEFENPGVNKLKKSDLQMSLKIKKTQDILAHVLTMKKPHQKVIGFAAESKLDDAILLEKFKRKPVDLLIGTQVSNGLNGEATQGFQNDEATYRLMSSLEEIGPETLLTKKNLAAMALPIVWGNQHEALH